MQGVVTEGISIFKGIPFAAPPVGDLRWKAPAPVQAWTGIKKADAFGPACMQAAGAMGNTAPVSEDCLYLNVWTPAKKPGEKIPVIVWIYGGGFSGGSTSTPMYDGMGFAKKGVVLVSVAYRVGPFGFFAHPELSRESGKGSGDLWTRGHDRGTEMGEGKYCPVWRRSFQCYHFRPLGWRHGRQHPGSLPGHQGPFPPRHLHERGIVRSAADFKSSTGMGLGIPSLKMAESIGEEFLKKSGAADIKAARALSAEEIQKNLAGGMGGSADSGLQPTGILSRTTSTRYIRRAALMIHPFCSATLQMKPHRWVGVGMLRRSNLRNRSDRNMALMPMLF